MCTVHIPILTILPAGLVFDLDGTVLDTMSHHWQAWKKVSAEYGLEMTLAKLVALSGMPTKAIFERLALEQGKDIDVESANAAKVKAYLDLAHETKPIEAVMEIIREGRRRGLPIAAATGGSRQQIEASLAHAGVWSHGDATHFDAIVTADEVTHGKPHPETFLKAAEAIGIAPEACVGYEDAQLGMQSVRAAGFLLAVDVTKLDG